MAPVGSLRQCESLPRGVHGTQNVYCSLFVRWIDYKSTHRAVHDARASVAPFVFFPFFFLARARRAFINISLADCDRFADSFFFFC